VKIKAVIIMISTLLAAIVLIFIPAEVRAVTECCADYWCGVRDRNVWAGGETWTLPGYDPCIPGYQCYWQKYAVGGYSLNVLETKVLTSGDERLDVVHANRTYTFPTDHHAYSIVLLWGLNWWPGYDYGQGPLVFPDLSYPGSFPACIDSTIPAEAVDIIWSCVANIPDGIFYPWFVDEAFASCGVYAVVPIYNCQDGETMSCYDGIGGLGQGICKSGIKTCSNHEWDGPCVGQVLPQLDSCDLELSCGVMGSNCECFNGETKPCYYGPDSTRGKGICHDGTQTCIGGRWDPTCNGEVLPEAEQCDNLDHNCNGLIADGFECKPGDTKHCYEGPGGTEGRGICRGGTQSCMNCQWDPTCIGEVLPEEEQCDDKDHNCNGETADGFECKPGETRHCYTGPDGTENKGICRGGSQACNFCQWDTDCKGQVLPEDTEKCDGKNHLCAEKPDTGCDPCLDNTGKSTT